MQIRRATIDDADAIAMINNIVWPGDSIKVEQVQRAIEHKDHATHVAVIDSRIFGFIDGFITRNPEFFTRWEVDLLAVHPDFRGRKTGATLVRQCTQTGYDMGADVVRCVIRVDNIASQLTFARGGYAQCGNPVLMLIAQPGNNGSEVSRFIENWVTIPVTTLTYEGIWLEAPVDKSFHGRDHFLELILKQPLKCPVGILLDPENSDIRNDAIASGFREKGLFHWWEHQPVTS